MVLAWVLWVVASECWQKPAEGFIEAGESVLKMVLSHGCWQEVSGLSHMVLSIGLPKCPHNMAAGFSQSLQRERKRERGAEQERERDRDS